MLPHGLRVAPDVQLVMRRRRQCELRGGAVHALQHRDHGHGEAREAALEEAAEEEENVGRTVQHAPPGGSLLLAETVDQHEGEDRQGRQLVECFGQQRGRAVVQRGVKKELERRVERGRVERVERAEQLRGAVGPAKDEALEQRRVGDAAHLEWRGAVVGVLEEGIEEGDAAPHVGHHAHGQEAELELLGTHPAAQRRGRGVERGQPGLGMKRRSDAHVVAVLAEEEHAGTQRRGRGHTPLHQEQAQRVVAQLLALGAVAGDEIDCVIVVQEEQALQLLSLLLLLFFVLLAAEGFERVFAAARRVGLRRVHEGDHPDWNGRGGREGDAPRGLQGEENGVRVVEVN